MSRDRYGVKFTKSAARRLAESARYVEQQPRNRAPTLRGPSEFAGPVMLKVTTALGPMSGGTPGAGGRGKIQKFDGTAYTDLSTDVYPILNDTEKTVAIGAYVLCLPGPGGKYHMVTVDKCSNLS